MTSVRTTKYSTAVLRLMETRRHATNADLLQDLRVTYPELSPTTVHRLTARLVARGVLGVAPTTASNIQRLDFNPDPHDHFSCSSCDCLRDVDLPPNIMNGIRSQLRDCNINGNVNIQGICDRCIKQRKEP